MPLRRVLEPEEMAGAEEAAEYDRMDFSATDEAFARRAAQLAEPGGWIVDIGCGNAKIPLAIAALAPESPVCGIEMSAEMLAVAVRNRRKSRGDGRAVPSCIELVRGDAKNLPFASGAVGLVTSNSLIHHIPDPRFVFSEVARILRTSPRGHVLIRDLVRPHSEADLDSLVEKYVSNGSAVQRRLYADSLHAALSLDEVRDFATRAGLVGVRVEQITDRHWSLESDNSRRS